jgi:hypothetical protein
MKLLIKDFLWDEDFRHGPAALNTTLEALGRSLASGNKKMDIRQRHVDGDFAL